MYTDMTLICMWFHLIFRGNHKGGSDESYVTFMSIAELYNNSTT